MKVKCFKGKCCKEHAVQPSLLVSSAVFKVSNTSLFWAIKHIHFINQQFGDTTDATNYKAAYSSQTAKHGTKLKK